MAETQMRVKFSDWVNTNPASSSYTVPASPNMRLLINEAGGMISGVGSEEIIERGSGDVKSYALGNEFTDQTLGGVPTSIDISDIDNDTSTAGRQVQFDVFTKIPPVTIPGFYGTNYWIEAVTPI